MSNGKGNKKDCKTVGGQVCGGQMGDIELYYGFSQHLTKIDVAQNFYYFAEWIEM
jgi:hypothetical protein